MDRNNYIEIHPTQAQVAKNFISPPIKISKSKCFPSTSIFAFSHNNFVVLSFSVITEDLTLSSKDQNAFCIVNCKEDYVVHNIKHLWVIMWQ
jgi:hypothetical protein